MALIVTAFQNNDKKKILIMHGIAGVFFGLHFFMLGAYTGAAMNVVGVFRNAAFLRYESGKRKTICVLVFTFLFILFGLISWENGWSLLPILAMSLSNVAVAFKNPKHIRYAFLPVFIGWLIYNIVSFSIAGVLTEVFDIVSLLIAMWRFDRTIFRVKYDK